MITIDGGVNFNEAVEQFLLMDMEKRSLVIERLELLLAAADYADHLDSIQTTH